MPTYRNDGANTQIVGSIEVAPGSTIQTIEILNIDDFTKISNEPYYNPVLQRETISFTSAETKEVVVNRPTEELTLVIRNIKDCNINVYFESTTNIPPIVILEPGQFFSIDLQRKVSKVVFVSDNYGSCEVTFWKTRG